MSACCYLCRYTHSFLQAAGWASYALSVVPGIIRRSVVIHGRDFRMLEYHNRALVFRKEMKYMDVVGI